MRRWAGVVVGVVMLVLAVIVLREATMGSSGTRGPGTRMEVVVKTHLVRERHMTALEMTESLIDVCGLQVASRVPERSVEGVGSATFRFVLQPAPDPSDQREFHGCLEDARIAHLQLDVLSMEVTPASQSPLPTTTPAGSGSRSVSGRRRSG